MCAPRKSGIFEVGFLVFIAKSVLQFFHTSVRGATLMPFCLEQLFASHIKV